MGRTHHFIKNILNCILWMQKENSTENITMIMNLIKTKHSRMSVHI